jgi:hypothetical protein
MHLKNESRPGTKTPAWSAFTAINPATMALLATPSHLKGVRMTGDNKKEHDALLAALSHALTEKTEEAVTARISLRDAVCAYVTLEHTRGTPLATVIQTVKAILAAAETEGATASDELAVQLIDWCVEFHRAKTRAKPIVIS